MIAHSAIAREIAEIDSDTDRVAPLPDDRYRRYRARKHRGQKVYRIALPEWTITAALLEAGLVTVDESLDAAAVAAALGRILVRGAKSNFSATRGG